MMRVLELYSGIGGMHYALKDSSVPFELAAAVDINTSANQIYMNNFPDVKLINRCIESVTIQEWDKLEFDMILMSPPCQPFCRVGKQQDIKDERSKSFLSLLDTLPRLAKPPSYILLENVKGFDTSKSRERLLEVLSSMEYSIQEFLLSPLQFGIPNSRLRYYLIAKKKPLTFSFQIEDCIRSDIPSCVEKYLIHRNDQTCSRIQPKEMNVDQSKQFSTSNNVCNTKSQDDNVSFKSDTSSINSITENSCVAQNINSVENIDLSKSEQCKQCREAETSVSTESPQQNDQHITCDSTESNKSKHSTDFFQSDHLETSLKRNSEHDKYDNNHHLEVPLYKKYQSICGSLDEYLEQECDEYLEQYLIPEKFFKRFWVMDIVTGESKNTCCFTKRYARHIEGSAIIQMNSQHKTPLSYFKTDRVYNDTVHEAVRSCKLRFFSPREIANIMCFPKTFEFPTEMSNIQCYRVLGNSLNVHVVSVLIKLMTMGDT